MKIRGSGKAFLLLLATAALGCSAQAQNFQKALARNSNPDYCLPFSLLLSLLTRKKKSVYEFPIRLANSKENLDWAPYKGKVIVFVNVASQ